jgi:hypothetical protein
MFDDFNSFSGGNPFSSKPIFPLQPKPKSSKAKNRTSFQNAPAYYNQPSRSLEPSHTPLTLLSSRSPPNSRQSQSPHNFSLPPFTQNTVAPANHTYENEEDSYSEARTNVNSQSEARTSQSATGNGNLFFLPALGNMFVFYFQISGESLESYELVHKAWRGYYELHSPLLDMKCFPKIHKFAKFFD